MAIQIPDPISSDSAKVVQLLQSAALFGRIGDTEEALHFLRQAAECAGDNGDDARTLTLARSAAELSGSLEPGSEPGRDGKSGVRARRLPQPPPRSRPAASADATPLPPSARFGGPPPAADADTAAEEEPVLLLKRTAPHSKPPAQVLGPAAPNDVSAEDRPPESRSALAPPPLPSVRANGSRPVTASTRPAPTPSQAVPASRPPAPALRSAPASRSAPMPSRPAPASRSALESRSPASRPAPMPSRPAPSLRPAPASTCSPTLAPVASKASAAPAAELVHPSLRQAARVSVERSSSDPGLLLVRVLEEGKAPDPGCTEALLVSIDAGARPFTG